jgi:predicted peptidase
MTTRRHVLFLFALLAAAMLPARGADDAGKASRVPAEPAAPTTASTGRQQPAKMERQVTVTVKANYLLFLPQTYGKDPARKWPLILFLHGSGERGDDLNKVKLFGLPKVLEQWKEFPFVVVSPLCPADKWWEPSEVIALLDEALEKYAVDPDRVYLTGMSMGGFGTWDTAISYPDRFAAIAPVCGAGNPYRLAAMKDVPTWVFHGEKDPNVPVAAAAQMAGTLQALGGKVKFTRYPNVGHDAWTPTYGNRALYDWFLQHKRGQPASAPAK